MMTAGPRAGDESVFEVDPTYLEDERRNDQQNSVATANYDLPYLYFLRREELSATLQVCSRWLWTSLDDLNVDDGLFPTYFWYN